MNRGKPRRIGRPRLGLQRVVQRVPLHEVERIGPEEHTADFPTVAIWREVKRLYRHRLHPAVALHIRHKGRVVMDRTLGHLHNEPGSGLLGDVATPDTLFNLFSATKIVTATLIQALVEDGVLDLDQRVAHYLPDFGRHGKEGITLKHLIQHTAGIPDMPKVPDLEAAVERGEVPLELLYELKPLTSPGLKVAYHSLTSWFLLQRIIEDATGKSLRPLLRERLLDPLGFTHMHYGVTDDLIPQVAQHAFTGLQVPRFMGSVFDRNIGLGVEAAVALTNRAGFMTATLPSANVIAPPHEVGRFMQMLLNGGELDGTRVLSARSVERMRTEVTPWQMDGTIMLPMSYGLGVMMGGDAMSLFGLGTAGAFGHLGLSNVVVYADPSRELAVAYLTTGKPFFAPGMVQWNAVLQRIAASVPRTAR